jgi:hypothetical protein
MVHADAVASVIGKRRRDKSVASLGHVDPSKDWSDEEPHSSETSAKRLRRSSRFSVASVVTPPAVENEESVSERALRAQRRASRDVRRRSFCTNVKVTKIYVEYTAYADIEIQYSMFNTAQ